MASQISVYSKITLLITIVIFFIPSATSSSSTNAGVFRKIYAFGDSYTDTGNAFLHGSISLPHPTHRYSDGRLVVDFLTETLSLPYLPPYLDQKADKSHGVNFAVAGATAIDHEFYVKNNLTIIISTPNSINTQLSWFNEFLESHGCRGTMSRECKELMDDALFWVGEIGANDYAYIIGSSVSSTTVQELAINTVTGFLQALLKMGAKYVVVQGLPTTGCLPLALTLAPTNDRDDIGCVASANKQSYTHNSLLQAKLQDLRKRHPQAVISYSDYWNAYRTVMKNTQIYKFKEPFKACCGSGGGPYNFDLFAFCGSSAASRACPNPAQFINWDGVHLTEAMNKVVARLLLHRGYCHPSFDILLSSKRREG